MKAFSINYCGLLLLMIMGSFIGQAQDLPDHVEISKDQSMRAGDFLDAKASVSIRVTEGFRMEPGSFLELRVVPLESISENQAATPLLFYPNPVNDRVVIVGTFGETVLRIYDLDGNIHHQSVLSGVDPVVDLSALRAGSYILRINRISERLMKE